MADPNHVAVHQIGPRYYEPAPQAEMIAAAEQLHEAVGQLYVAWSRGKSMVEAHDKMTAVFEAMAAMDVAIGRNP